jgi:uncharacterized protein
MLEVETSDLQGLPTLIDSAMAAGANRVDQIVFESSDFQHLHEQARDQAWQAARAEAEQLAQRAGTRLDRIVSVDEPVLEQATTIRADDRVVAYGIVAGTPSTVQVGELEVRARLHIAWSTQ